MPQRKGTKRSKPYNHYQPPRKCAFPGCDNVFTPMNANQHYCKEIHMGICESCGKPFVIKHLENPAKTCSKECSIRLSVKNRPPYSTFGWKCVQTNLKNRGTMYPMQSKAVQQKSAETSMAHFGTKHPSSSDIVKKRIEETLLKKYNVHCGCQIESVRSNFKMKSKPNIAFAKHFELANIPVEFDFPLGRFLYDLHIPNTNVLIEINPTITHNVHMSPWGKPKDPDYHFRKTKFAEDKGYVCILVWDWDNIIEIILHLKYSTKFKITGGEPKLHWFNSKTKDHIVSSDMENNDLLSNGYLPIYDDGNIIEYIY